jgi:ABC-type branched-subunit amino acid transport system ATPase component/branched-subunit amino acid ABC-type transport system permease component
VKELLPFIISGITVGSLYGMAGTGLVLTYKTSGIFNFGHGANATIAAYVFYWLHIEHGWSWWLALIVSVFVVGPILGLIMERIARQLALQRTSHKIVATVGLIVLVQGIATIWYGSDTLPVAQYLPKGSDSFEVGGVFVSYAQVTLTVISIIVVGALYVLFRYTRLGIAMRAVVGDPDLVDIIGANPISIRQMSWVIGTTFAALSGVLLLPLIGLQAIALTLLVAQAFAAAAFGAFNNIPLTFLGGLGVGILANVSKKYVLDVSWLSGLPSSLPFLVLIVMLLLLPKWRLVPPSSVERRPPLAYRAPLRFRLGTAVPVLALFLLVPTFAGIHLSYFTLGLTQAILLLSLGLLVRTSGQVSLCHTTFAAVAAVAFSQFSVDHHMPWLAAVLLGALVAVPIGALVAIPAIRLSGLFLALATFGFGIMVENLFYPLGFMFTHLADGRRMPRPDFATGDKAYYYVVLAFLVVICLVVVAIHESRIGRILRGLSDAPLAVATMGLSTNVTRVIVFCISSFIAGLAGILYGSSANFATSADIRYTAFTSLTLIAILALAPFREPWFALFMGFTAIIPGYISGEHVNDYLNIIFGFFAVQVSLQGGPTPMPQKLQAYFNRFGRKPAAVATQVEAPPPVAAPEGGPGLAIDGLTIRFGGLVAVKDVSLRAPLGTITGLVGPNGAGKTTTFNACSGLNKPNAGKLTFQGRDVSRLAPARRARLGLGRTFQRMELGETLTVVDNVALGRESSMAGGKIFSQFAARPAERRVTHAAAWSAMETCGITHLAELQAGALSTGQRRLVELARCLAGPFDLLLLDEPSSGLDRAETERFGEVLTRVVQERGCGILLVEHDMSLVMKVCSYLYVLDFGQLLFEGDPQAVAGSEVVQAAYLGGSAAIPAGAEPEVQS